MRRLAQVKFPNSVQLFKFCQKVLSFQKKEKIHDQEIGNILDLNPSDCSHWKKGEKNLKSVFALSRLSEALKVNVLLLHDLILGRSSCDEAFYEFTEGLSFSDKLKSIFEGPNLDKAAASKRVELFVGSVLKGASFQTPPLFLPEVFARFNFVQLEQAEMIDKLSRIMRIKQGQYLIQHRRGELNAQVRMSVAKDLARIILKSERSQFSELGEYKEENLYLEECVFVRELLVPLGVFRTELNNLEVKKNQIQELAHIFWAPQFLINLQLENLLNPLINVDAAWIQNSSRKSTPRLRPPQLLQNPFA